MSFDGWQDDQRWKLFFSVSTKLDRMLLVFVIVASLPKRDIEFDLSTTKIPLRGIFWSLGGEGRWGD